MKNKIFNTYPFVISWSITYVEDNTKNVFMSVVFVFLINFFIKKLS